ncbi:hypothetical protein [Desulfoluna spongiiphila]|uniref:hypothetical protein n=1 Tax=Desulfoluna spongiiphila TaxID=419481 RepID=UPI001255805B|nr:hypothetical protein [Desulfoluna spongiiphila]VVS92211.1 consensus disorder prediction [Desulfoluna spongiiphila]
MKQNALESRMESIMSDAYPDTSPQHPAPAPAMNRRWVATLMLAAALFGAMITGLICLTSSPPSSALMEAVGAKQGEPTIDVFFLGFGRYRN